MVIWQRASPVRCASFSDHGNTSEQLQRLIADHGVICSISAMSGIMRRWKVSSPR
jgi:hypothetical protein